jgi:putative methyltransferase (TIGR04325 family)
MSRIVKAMLMHSTLGAWAGAVPFVPALYVRTVWSKRMNLFFGLFDSFEEAEAFVAGVKKVGWDDEGIAKVLVGGDDLVGAERSEPQMIQTSQFAVMLWLTKLLQPGNTVLDLGGAGGIFYEICTRYGLLDMPLKWHVVDMPEMIKRGRARHDALQSTSISFGSQLPEAPASDIMLMLGAIQYMPDPLGEKGPGVLDALKTLPNHVLINKVPLIDGNDRWTVQNHVTTACPYRLFDRRKLMAYFETRGYRLQDKWYVPEIDIEIPFRPDGALFGLQGLYFRREIAVCDVANEGRESTPLPSSEPAATLRSQPILNGP